MPKVHSAGPGGQRHSKRPFEISRKKDEVHVRISKEQITFKVNIKEKKKLEEINVKGKVNGEAEDTSGERLHGRSQGPMAVGKEEGQDGQEVGEMEEKGFKR